MGSMSKCGKYFSIGKLYGDTIVVNYNGAEYTHLVNSNVKDKRYKIDKFDIKKCKTEKEIKQFFKKVRKTLEEIEKWCWDNSRCARNIKA